MLAIAMVVISLAAWYLFKDSGLTITEINETPVTKEMLEEQISDISNSDPLQPQNDARQAYNFIVLGLDSKEVLKGRSDAILYVHLNHYKKEVKVLSFMRDLRVKIEGYGYDKLGHAYAYGRERLATRTVEENFDVTIDAFIALNFSIVIDIVDLLGGLELSITDKEVSQISGLETPGTYLMNGEQVLAYARIRKVGNGDFERTLRQRLILEKVISKLSSLSNDDLFEVVTKIYPLIYTDLDIDEIYDEIDKYRTDGQTYTMTSSLVPFEGLFREARIDGLYYLVIEDIEKNKDMIKKFLKESE